jgi:HSP20 family protein
MNSLFPISRFSLSNPLRGDIESLFDSFFNAPLRAVQRTDDSYYSIPRANVAKGDEGYMIQLAAPGYSREDFGINIEDNSLTITCVGESDDSPEMNMSYTTQEYSYNSFSRSWGMPPEANTDGITARYDAGILTVNIPVTNASSATHTVEVQ